MRHRIALFLLFIVPGTTLSAEDLDPQRVTAAIEQGIRFLKSKQGKTGLWPYPGESECGLSSICVMALLTAGVPKDDPVIERAMQAIRKFRAGMTIDHNYSISLQTMAYAFCDPERDRGRIRENVLWLEKAQFNDQSPSSGGWTYTSAKGGGVDSSNTQFSVLALYEAERVGVPVKDEVWKRARAYWERIQNNDGSWGYSPLGQGSSSVRGSMICAGIASMIITSGMTDRGGAAVRGEQIVCNLPDNAVAEKRIQAGLKRLESIFSVERNPGEAGGSWLFYYLYSLERVGRMSSRRFIGTHDWYREGTEFLLKRKGDLNISWSEHGEEVLTTAYAILFLAKGRLPVLMSKAEYGTDRSWDIHPNDVDHLVRFTEKQWNFEMTWQTLSLDVAKAEDLMQTPVLYICGSKSPLPKNEKRRREYAEKLRAYLDQGGFIFAEALSNDAAFDKGFRELMTLVLPEPGYELQLLPLNHPIWQAEFSIEPDQLRPIEGIDFGCRTSVVYCPTAKRRDGAGNRPSLSCLWEIAKPLQRGNLYPQAVAMQVDAGLSIGVNVLAYATNRERKTKDQKLAETLSGAMKELEQRRGKVYLGVMEPGGGANSAPHAVPNMLRWAQVGFGLSVDVRVNRLTPESPEFFDHPLVFVHGRTAFSFTETERERLKKYLENGGTLFVNAICGSKLFVDSFREEMKTILPDKPLVEIPADDPLLSEEFGGFEIKRLKVRIPEQSPGRSMRIAEKEIVPELQGIKMNNRFAVVFSPLDVSCALEKTSSLDCKGYTQESALELAINVLLYALEYL